MFSVKLPTVKLSNWCTIWWRSNILYEIRKHHTLGTYLLLHKCSFHGKTAHIYADSQLASKHSLLFSTWSTKSVCPSLNNCHWQIWNMFGKWGQFLYSFLKQISGVFLNDDGTVNKFSLVKPKSMECLRNRHSPKMQSVVKLMPFIKM